MLNMEAMRQQQAGKRNRSFTDEDQMGSQPNDNWTLVENGRKNKRARRAGVQEENQAPPRLNKFRVIASTPTDAYRIINHATETNRRLNMSARPNLKSEWIITPKDSFTYNYLKTTTLINVVELKNEEKKKKAVIVGYPYNLPLSELNKNPQICEVERMKNKYGTLSKTILCTFIGRIPDKVDLGQWGRYSTKTYYPEPLRCYNCQKYGHHRSACNAQAICAVCSGRHETAICIRKHKEHQPTTLRCPNCKNRHPAWSRRCPVRLQKVRAALPSEHRTPAPRAPTTRTPVQRDSTPRQRPEWPPLMPTPLPNRAPATRPAGPNPPSSPRTSQRPSQTQRAPRGQRTRSETRPEEKRTSPLVAPEVTPRTIFLDKNKAKEEIDVFTEMILISVESKTDRRTIEKLSDVLLTNLLEASRTRFSKSAPSAVSSNNPSCIPKSKPNPPTTKPPATSTSSSSSKPQTAPSSSTSNPLTVSNSNFTFTHNLPPISTSITTSNITTSNSPNSTSSSSKPTYSSSSSTNTTTTFSTSTVSSPTTTSTAFPTPPNTSSNTEYPPIAMNTSPATAAQRFLSSLSNSLKASEIKDNLTE